MRTTTTHYRRRPERERRSITKSRQPEQHPERHMVVEGDWTATDLGPCCICGIADQTVRNMLTLPQRSPTPGRGWGCRACGLPSDGALAVVCDGCLRSRDGTPAALAARLVFVCRGYPASDGRVPVTELDPTPFDHDPAVLH